MAREVQGSSAYVKAAKVNVSLRVRIGVRVRQVVFKVRTGLQEIL